MVLANFSIYYKCKNNKLEYNNYKSKFLLDLVMVNLIYRIVNFILLNVILLLIYNIILNIALKKHETIADNPPVEIYTVKIKITIVF